MKSYFTYRLYTLCGILKICLTGTKEDWQNILTRVQNMAEFDLEWWTKDVEKIVKEFVNVFDDNINIRFWDQAYKNYSHGSGSDIISGWACLLFPYLEENGNKIRNKYLGKNYDKINLGSDDFPNSISKVPFEWIYYNEKFDMEFLAGMVGVHQAEDLSVEPVIGWAVGDKI